MLPNNIIKEQSISAANSGHSPCDELSIGLVSSSSSSRWGQTIVLILPGGDTHQHNHQRQLLPFTMCDRSYNTLLLQVTSDFSQNLESRPTIKLKVISYTFRSQKTSTVQQFVIRNKLKESTTIFHLTFSLHEERDASGHNEGARTGGCNMSDCQMTALVQCTSQLWSLSRSGPPNGLGSHHLRQAAAGCPPPAILSAG